MKKYLSVICFLTIVYTLCAQNNVITYTASAKLEEVTENFAHGLNTNAFNVNIVSHTFADGTGIITFEGEVTSIGDNAFYRCVGLTLIQIPNSVTSIGFEAFWSCSGLTSINIPNNVTSIGRYAFSGCSSLTSIEIPSSMTSIGDRAFWGCSGLRSFVVESANVIYDSRNGCNAIIETASNTLVFGCKNTIIPSSVTSIGEGAFSGCSTLTSVMIPNSVTWIGNHAFSYCDGLTSIEIPSSITSIDYNAFADCSNLTSVTCNANLPPSLGSNVFRNVPHNIPLYVPAVSIPLYQATDQWNAFDVQFILVEIDSVSPDTTNITWFPIDSASTYQLHIYSNQIAMDTTLTILADPNNGGIISKNTISPCRQHRIVLDDGVGTLVVVVFDDNSGATSNQPFIVSVSTSSTNRIDLKYDMTVLGASNNIIHKEPGSFTLNEDAPLYEALGDVHSSPLTSDSFCYDLYGHRYPRSQWPSLPAGIYILHEGGVTTKIMKH